MKVEMLRTLQHMMSALPDQQLREISDARHWIVPENEMERVVLFVAAATQQWREECQNS
jgi:hypothetical protein